MPSASIACAGPSCARGEGDRGADDAVLDGGITIDRDFLQDHDPPHFHAMQAEHEILVEIARLVVFARRGSPSALWSVPFGDAPMIGSAGEGVILVGRVGID